MKKNIFLIGFIFSIFIFGNCFSQNIDQVLQKYYEATGGKANWEAVKSIKITGFSNIMGMDIPYTQYVKRPGKWMIEIFVQSAKIVQAYDGSKGWMINPMTGSKKPAETDDETTKIFINNSLIGGKLYNIDEMGFKVELAGKEDLNGKEVYKVNVTDKDGVVTVFYIDADTYLITKSNSKITRMGNEFTTEIFYSNYKKVNDLMFAYLLDQKVTGSQIENQTVNIDKIEIDSDISDDIFKMPTE